MRGGCEDGSEGGTSPRCKVSTARVVGEAIPSCAVEQTLPQRGHGLLAAAGGHVDFERVWVLVAFPTHVANVAVLA